VTSVRRSLPEPAERKNRSVAVPDLHQITLMQQRFVDEYLIDLSAKDAAIRAGFAPRSAANTGAALLRHGPVQDAVRRAMAARSVRVGISQDRVLQHLGAQVFGDPSSVFNEHGGLKKPHEMDVWDRRMIAGVKTRRIVSADEDGNMQPEEITEIKLVDNATFTGMLMKHLGMMNDKLDITITSVADRLNRAQSRLRGVGIGGTDMVDVDEDGNVIGDSEEHEAARLVAEAEAEALQLEAPEQVLTLAELLGEDE
jgi:phage terminase small subunit